ncbi:Fcf2 pre-rRNA processing [Penicillium verhagenii]|uniref:Fcf2 pre-rRNA processing n=1 Tax=Penicillium verhagenii TaxID=1562060 RepID=UPI002545A142|nr:Fcf2 pre-rRNA processing [Penicillium verhagenii]KAJ5921553.1 Fcf2 pre-rRNA processing [Penicillium verhagenii]
MTSTHVEVNVQPQEEVDLTDDQVQQLLLEAESRLRGSDLQLVQDSDIASIRVTRTHGTDSVYDSIPKLTPGTTLEPYVRQSHDFATADTAQLVDQKQKKLSNSLHLIQQAKKSTKDKATAGPQWFDLPKTELTTELKRDLQLLRMRSVLDSKRHYKKENGKAKLPEFSQVGTIIEGPTEFFSGRIAKKDRKKTFVAEAMALERQTRRFESKYRDIQSTKQSGKKAFYNNLKAKRNRNNK